MERAQTMLQKAGYDAYIEHGHLYYRTSEGGVVEVSNEREASYLVEFGTKRCPCGSSQPLGHQCWP